MAGAPVPPARQPQPLPGHDDGLHDATPISVRVNTGHAKRLRDALGTIKVTKLTVAQVEKFLAGMAQQGYASSTIRNTRGLLRLALRRAERDHGLSRNVAALASVPHGSYRQSQSMTAEQMGKLLALELSPWWRAYLSAAFMLGLRVGELHGLSWQDVDFDAGVIRVRQSLKRIGGKLVLSGLKTASSRRTLAMPAAVAGALKVHRQAQLKARMRSAGWQDHDLVFCSRAGTPRKPMATDKRFKQLCELAGIGSGWQLRETRHTVVSVLSSYGVHIEAIADMAGHANSRVTQTVYRHQLGDTISTAATIWDSINQAKDETG